jgi:hypothetical protein
MHHEESTRKVFLREMMPKLEEIAERYGAKLTTLGALGISSSAMVDRFDTPVLELQDRAIALDFALGVTAVASVGPIHGGERQDAPMGPKRSHASVSRFTKVNGSWVYTKEARPIDLSEFARTDLDQLIDPELRWLVG